MSANRKQAKALAARRFVTIVLPAHLDDGTTIYMARNPELPDCLAEGDSYEAAVQMLLEMREDYFEHLLDFGLPLPKPISLENGTFRFVLVPHAEPEKPPKSVPLKSVLKQASVEEILA